MDDDPFAGLGLKPVALSDAATFQPYLASLSRPLSDYTFSQIYSWRNSLRIVWRLIDNHLCIFANGAGDLTLLMPPIGDGNASAALRQAFALMDQYNAKKNVPERSRVEYISEELLPRFDTAGMAVTAQGADYVYDTARMIDLAGGDLASKRQAKNRFLRNYGCRVETYDPKLHLSDCQGLLDRWKNHQDTQHGNEESINAVKRQKETTATELTLRCAAELGLRGMVVYVRGGEACPDDRWTLGGFTFGENLGADQASITIEKTDLQVKGLAQFIFSEFCSREWASRPLTNVGDDWGLETLAWTKQSYRPVAMLKKFTIQRTARLAVAMPEPIPAVEPMSLPQPTRAPEPIAAPAEIDSIVIRAAQPADLAAVDGIEQTCFERFRLRRRQLQYLQSSRCTVFFVAERAGQIIGEGIALVRQHRRQISGRIYSLAVRPDCRGQRIGQRLLKSMIDALAERGVRRIYLEVQEHNEPALALYKSANFAAIGVLPNYYGPGLAARHMVYTVAEQPSLPFAAA